MPIDARIPLMARGADPLNALAAGFQASQSQRQNALNNQLLQEKVDQAPMRQKQAQAELDTAEMKKQSAFDELAKGSFQADYHGAYQLAPYLDAGDTNSVMGILEERKALKTKLGYPTTSEDNFLQLLQSDPEGAKGIIKQVIERGQQLFGTRQNQGSPKIYQTKDGVFSLSPDGTQSRLGDLPPTSASEQAAIQAKQSAAIASALGLPVDGQQPQGGVPSPNPSVQPNVDYSQIPPDQIPKVLDAQKAQREMSQTKSGDSQRLRNVTKSFADTLADPNIGKATGLWGSIRGAVGQKTGADEGILYGRLKRRSRALVLETAQAMKGALSNNDIVFLEGTKPEPSDDVRVWEDWYANEFVPYIRQVSSEKGIDFDALGLPETISAASSQGAVDRSGATHDLEYDPATGSFK